MPSTVTQMDQSSALQMAGRAARGDLNALGALLRALVLGQTMHPVTYVVPITGQAKVGATAGWIITAADNLGHATLPASQTSSTLVIPLPPLPVGSIITGFGICGQVESAGANVTLTANLRKLTNAAADNADASVATDNVGTLTADTILSQANLGATGLSEVVAADESFYILLTGTTAALTDIDITHAILNVTSGV